LQATQLGDPEFLTPGECRAAMDSTEGQVERPWNLWKQAAAERRPS
jgi:HCOMODA/2-hydroxy-3-carboxy-muconic semialdehyde decarboxylase